MRSTRLPLRQLEGRLREGAVQLLASLPAQVAAFLGLRDM
jgi:hypothetical protein